MHVISVNVGQPQRMDLSKTKRSAILKRPVEGPVRVTRDGLEGDTVADKRHHGGPDQAVYVYGWPDYAWFADNHGIAPGPGLFGENLTIAGFESATARIGDRYQIGDVLLEATAPRIPCGTLAQRMKDVQFINLFRHAERPGVYCRVITEGSVQAGAAFQILPFAAPTVTLVEMFRDFYEPDMSKETIERYLNAPIAERPRKHKEEQLANL